MNGLEAVTDLAVYLSKAMSVQVFKHEKKTNFTGEYIVVNSLPFAFGKVVNDSNVLNVNIHVPDMSTEEVDSKRLGEILAEVEGIIPKEVDIEEEQPLILNGCYYTITSDSNPIKDTDGTHFLNLIIKVVFTEVFTEIKMN